MYLITGGLGFIGNELARQLASQSEVVILDNRTRVAPRIEDLSPLPVHVVDITAHEQVAALVRDLKPQVVFHLAAIHYIPECNAHPERTLCVNVEGTLGMLNACAAAGVGHFLLASSGAVYADSGLPLNESSTVAPVDIYGWTKWFAEELCRWEMRRSGLPVTVCRLFNNYGPRETSRHIIPELIHQARAGDQLSLGNTTTRRDYIHTSDTVTALTALARTPPDGERTVNIGSGTDASVEELVVILGELLGRSFNITRDPSRLRAADKQVQRADIRALQALTGWTPQVELRSGLEQLLRFEGLLR
jgi:UDP-glucose 4-epimerase